MIINCVAYRNGIRIGDIALDDISEVRHQPDTFVWLGLHEPDAAIFSKLKEEFGLHELALEDAQKAHQRPKLEAYGDTLFLVMKTAWLEKGCVGYGETHFFLGKQFLVTIRHGETHGYARLRSVCEEQPEMLAKGPAFALYALLDFIVDNYVAVVEHFEDRLEELEDQVFDGPSETGVNKELYVLKRSLLTLRNATLPVDEICTSLIRFHEQIISKEIRPYFRDVQDHALRVVSSVDHMRDMVMTAMQVNLSLVSVSQNEVVKRISGWAAIFAIPTILFSLYGMNFRYMPELEWQWGYPSLLGVTTLACFLLFRKLRAIDWI